MTNRAPRAASFVAVCVLLIGGLAATGSPASSQEYSLFDKFNIGFGASALNFDTAVRVDALGLGGTEIDFEDTLGISSDEFTPSLSFSWNPGRRHNIFGRWDATERDGTEVVSTELRFGDLVVPIDATVMSAFDLDELLLGYTYYPWLRDRWALGFGLGFRLLDISSAINIVVLPQGQPITLVDNESAEVAGPMPFINIDYRYGITPNWRLSASFGVIDVSINDFEGSQTVVGAGVEHLAWQRFSWGFRAGFSAIDADVTATDYVGSAKIDILRGGFFAKARW